jgi:hypothetical protein
LHSLVLERIESDLSKINWLRGVILLIPIELVPWGRFPLCHSYQTYFSFPGLDLNLDCGLRDHVITSSHPHWPKVWFTVLKDNYDI